MTDKVNFDELKKFYPEPSIEVLTDYDMVVLKNNMSVGKFVKRDALTHDEMEEFCKKLNDEWVKEVVDPYCKSLLEFCKKYEIAMLESDCSLNAMPMMMHMMKDIEKRFGDNPLSKMFNCK